MRAQLKAIEAAQQKEWAEKDAKIAAKREREDAIGKAEFVRSLDPKSSKEQTWNERELGQKWKKNNWSEAWQIRASGGGGASEAGTRTREGLRAVALISDRGRLYWPHEPRIRHHHGDHRDHRDYHRNRHCSCRRPCSWTTGDA